MPKSIRDLVYSQGLRELLASPNPVDHNKTPAEATTAALMPGDDVGSHPLYIPFNKWANKPPTVIRRMLEAGEIPESELEWAMIALQQWGPSSKVR